LVSQVRVLAPGHIEKVIDVVMEVMPIRFKVCPKILQRKNVIICEKEDFLDGSGANGAEVEGKGKDGPVVAAWLGVVEHRLWKSSVVNKRVPGGICGICGVCDGGGRLSGHVEISPIDSDTISCYVEDALCSSANRHSQKSVRCFIYVPHDGLINSVDGDLTGVVIINYDVMGLVIVSLNVICQICDWA
jgi:hypothetical protein